MTGAFVYSDEKPLPDSAPRAWTDATIGEMIAHDGVFVDGDWVESKDQDPNGDVRLIQLADIGDGSFRNRSDRYLTSSRAAELRCTFLVCGDVLIARMPDPLGRACIFPGDPKPSVTAVDVCIVRTGQGSMDHRWLMHFINSPQSRADIASYQSGSTRKRISRRNLGRIQYPVPPLPEQRRIVEAIEMQFTRLDAAVAALERAQANLQRYRASVLKAACEGRLVPTEAELARTQGRDYEPADVLLQRILAERRARWEAEQWEKEIERAQKKAAQARRKAEGLPSRIRDLEPEEWQGLAEEDYGRYLPKNDKWKHKYKEPQAPDTEDLPDLPAGWVWTGFEQLGELDRGKSRHRPRNDERLYGGPYPFIQTGEVRQADGTISAYSQTYSEAGLAQSQLWPRGTLCITIAANIAETGILGFDACFPDSVVGFLPQAGIDVRYIEFFMRTARESLERYAPATAQKNINLAVLRQVAVALPPSCEHKRIVDEVDRRLSIARASAESVAGSLARAERLRQAILKRAFEGRLVPQDPCDEPASELLERIRAMRARVPLPRHEAVRQPELL